MPPVGMMNPLQSMFGNLAQPGPISGPVPPQGGPLPPGPAPPQAAAPSLDINTLLNKLIATGIIKKDAEPAPASEPVVSVSKDSAAEDQKEETKEIKPHDLLSIRKKVRFYSKFTYSKTCVKWSLKNRQNKYLNEKR